MVKTVPRQLPKGVNAAELEKDAESASDAMKGMVFVQLIAQLFLKGAMNDLWNLYFTLQIMCYLQIYDIPIPSNSEIYVQEFTKIIEFEILNPEALV